MTGFGKSIVSSAVRGGRIACAGALAGCVLMQPKQMGPEAPVVDEAPAVEQEAAPQAVPAALPPEPAEKPAPLAVEPPPPPKVAVLLPAGLNGFDETLADLERELAARSFETALVETSDSAAQEALGRVGERPDFVIAVGSEAARIAIEQLRLPTVFCQIPDQEFGAAGAYGVATLPPLELQLKGWKQLDPGLRRIGLILSDDEYLLAAHAQQAAAAAGLTLEIEIASSDQEAVYLFKRLAPDIDGLWLLPDNSILSPRALREMLEHASARRLQSLAFTPALLEWGALLSVSGTPANVASTLADVVGRLAAGESEHVPRITPLSELEVRVNGSVADLLGLRPPSEAWIVRGEDG